MKLVLSPGSDSSTTVLVGADTFLELAVLAVTQIHHNLQIAACLQTWLVDPQTELNSALFPFQPTYNMLDDIDLTKVS